MAVTKQDVLSFISQHSTSERPNVPAKEIVAVLGKEAAGIINELKKAGSIIGTRGRVGGVKIVSADAPAAAQTETVEAPVVSDDVASQFAALMEKLEADEAAQEAVAV